jgi:hypothetical protein
MRSKRILGRFRRYSVVSLLSGMMAFQFGGCIPSEFTAIETTTVTLDGRGVITSLINAAIISPLQALVADSVNNFFDGLVAE